MKKATVGFGQEGGSYPLKIEQVLLKRLPGLCLLALIYNVRVLFVSTAFVVLAAMSLPVPQTHPAKVCRREGGCKLLYKAYGKAEGFLGEKNTQQLFSPSNKDSIEESI